LTRPPDFGGANLSFFLRIGGRSRIPDPASLGTFFAQVCMLKKSSTGRSGRKSIPSMVARQPMNNTLVFRTAILSSLFEHLRAHYDVEPEMGSIDRVAGDHSSIESLLAFRSDPKLEALRGALTRLDNGSFGMCLKCKSPITDAKLADDVTIRLCPSCERDLASKSPTFGKFATFSTQKL
jgi:RNA polymerase-binding transcription factor DksA